jgi:hypothetical protein
VGCPSCGVTPCDVEVGDVFEGVRKNVIVVHFVKGGLPIWRGSNL